MLPVVSLVEDTFYKLNAWFVERHAKATVLASRDQLFSDRVEEKLRKHREKGSVMHVVAYGSTGTEYEVQVPSEIIPPVVGQSGIIQTHERACKYRVVLGANNQVTCECQGPQLVRIPCSHVRAVCRKRNFLEDVFVDNYYRTDCLLNTWGASFHSYPNQYQWPYYLGPTVVPDKKWIRKGRRKHKRRVMEMDRMQGRRVGHEAHCSTTERQIRGM
jgi:hypothetical protein